MKRSGWVLKSYEILCAAGLAVLAAQAGTQGFIVPEFRGRAGSQTGTWEIFTQAAGAPGNVADQPGVTTDAILTQLDAGAFLTGSGNIYNMEGTSRFEVTDTTAQPVGTVVLQVRTVGTELDYGTVRLVYTRAGETREVRPLFRQELSRTQGQGFNVSSLWQWNLAGLGVETYVIRFEAAGHSLSLDSVSLDSAEQFSPAASIQPFVLGTVPASVARWNYPFNSDPATRPVASVFGALGSAGSFDSRDAQFLLGWPTTNAIPAGQGSSRYLIRRARVTLTIASQGQFAYNGVPRDFRTYFPTNDPGHLAPTNTAFPVELFGVGFRGGVTGTDGVFVPYNGTNYPQNGPWGASATGGFHSNRVAYAAGFNPRGLLVDVSNNVADDETNEVANAFEVAPFAVGTNSQLAPGDVLTPGSPLSFDLNLKDPLILAYVQEALNQGRLNLMVTCLVPASMSGTPAFPTFFTTFSSVAGPEQHPVLDLEGTLVRPAVDSDTDGLPDDWENFHFGSLLPTGDADPDDDGVSNRAEYEAGTDPNDPDSVLQVTSVTLNGGTTEIRYTAGPGTGEGLQWSNDLKQWDAPAQPDVLYTSEWLSKSVPSPVYPAPVYRVWRDTGTTESVRLYRVVAP